VGRKLYSLFRQAGLREVRVRLYPFYVVAGAAPEQLLEDWRTRFDALEPAMTPEFGGAGAYRAFCNEYLRMLEDEDALKYGVTLVTEGIKP
jgi:hypothetical protein